MQVDRCICANVTFAKLLGAAEAQGRSLDALADATGCASGCGLCEPYIRLALATGKTTFPVLHPLTIERMIDEAGAG